MRLLEIYVGDQDFGRYWGLELTLLGISAFLGMTWDHWLALRLELRWPHFYRDAHWRWFRKEIIGERVLEWLVRKLAPGWRAP